MAIDVARRIAAIVSKELNTDVSTLPSKARLREDLGMDSIVALNLIFALERDLGIRIAEEDVARLQTVADLTALVSEISGHSPS